MNHRFLMIILLAGLLTGAAAAEETGGELVLTLEPRIELPAGQQVHLGEIAQIEGAGAKQAAAITLGHVPGPGRRRALSAVSIKRALERAGFVKGSFRILGAAQPRVVGLGQPIDQARVRDVLTRTISAMVSGGRVKILDLQVPANIQLEPGEYQLRVLTKNQPLRSGANRIPLEIVAASGKKRKVGVYAKLEIKGPVLVVAREVPRGERIRPGDLRMETRVFPTGAPVLHDPEMAVGKAARSTLRVGQHIRASALESARAVHSGQTVLATFKHGAVSLVLETRARGRGDVGAIVPVLGVDGKSLVRARVVAPGKVEVIGSDEDSVQQTTEAGK